MYENYDVRSFLGSSVADPFLGLLDLDQDLLVRDPSIIKQKKFVGVLKDNDKKTGSGSISQRHVSADPDPYQNVTDPQHCLKVARPTAAAMSPAPSTPVMVIHDVISSTWKRGRTRCYSEVTSSPYSRYGYL
jgi:hypothetical protein